MSVYTEFFKTSREFYDNRQKYIDDIDLVLSTSPYKLIWTKHERLGFEKMAPYDHFIKTKNVSPKIMKAKPKLKNRVYENYLINDQIVKSIFYKDDIQESTQYIYFQAEIEVTFYFIKNRFYSVSCRIFKNSVPFVCVCSNSVGNDIYEYMHENGILKKIHCYGERINGDTIDEMFYLIEEDTTAKKDVKLKIISGIGLG